MRKPIVIGIESFPTKKMATERCRTVLYRYATGQTVSSDDARFLGELLLLHAEADQKIGCGVASFQVEQNGPTRGFWLTRTDGTRTDFSFIACLTPRTPEREALDGLRWAVRDQIRAFRESALVDGARCAVTGVTLAGEATHVDHDPAFLVLVDDFLQSRGLGLADVSVEPTADGEIITVLADEALAQAWADYHRANAHLRLVTQSANLGLLRRRVAR
jgi:hypothetical protein